ncbi:MAG: hypothetical protein ACTSX6_00270 [Candidatus Heimdallarchaeaceae archaeon]
MAVIIGPSGYSADTTSEGRLKVDAVVTIEAIQQANIWGWNKDSSQWNKVLVREYPAGSGHGWLSIWGEVGSITKAKNPINISIRKVLATKDLTVFYDATVPTDKIWYIAAIDVADDLGAEFNVWEGVERNRVEYFSGDGVTKDFNTDHAIINDSNYITVKVGGVEQVFGTDYTVSVSDNGETGTVSFASAPPSGTDNIEVTYDAVIRRSASFVQASSSYTHKFEAPLRLTEGKFIIASVSNKSANAGVVCLNISGFQLSPDEEVW